MLVCLTINEISCSYYLCVRHHGWFHKVTIHHEICMVSHTARVRRPKEDVRAPPQWKTSLLQGNKHKRHQTLPQCCNHSVWWIACCQTKWTICASKGAHHNPKISTAWTPYLNQFTTLPFQCKPDEDCYETLFLCCGYGQSHWQYHSSLFLILSIQECPTLCYWMDHIWSTWDHWQHICSWRYETRKAAYIYFAGMPFLLHYSPSHWGRESQDTLSCSHLVLYRAKTHGRPLCCCSYWFSLWILSSCQWSHSKVP